MFGHRSLTQHDCLRTLSSWNLLNHGMAVKLIIDACAVVWAEEPGQERIDNWGAAKVNVHLHCIPCMSA